jgi:hypothetical protein
VNCGILAYLRSELSPINKATKLAENASLSQNACDFKDYFSPNSAAWGDQKYFLILNIS